LKDFQAWLESGCAFEFAISVRRLEKLYHDDLESTANRA
jgi:hypothetical protein